MPDGIITAGDFSSHARYLFDRFTGPDGIAHIRALVGQTPRVTEDNWLEFKSGKVRDEDIRPLWSKALGSFANSGGGVLVWGIRADRDGASGIDAVQEEAPVPDVERLVHKLKEWQPPATDAPVPGVVVQPMLLPGSAKEGFVVCLIPESNSKPHRSEFGKGDVKRFYMRIGDSTQECTVPILRQLFYPRHSPKLTVTLTLKNTGQAKNVAHAVNGTTDKVRLVGVKIANTGSSSVFDVHVRIRCDAHEVYSDTPGQILQEFGTVMTNASLHPSLDLTFDVLGYLTTPMIFRGAKWTVEVFARDIEPRRAVISYEAIFANYQRQVTVDCV